MSFLYSWLFADDESLDLKSKRQAKNILETRLSLVNSSIEKEKSKLVNEELAIKDAWEVIEMGYLSVECIIELKMLSKNYKTIVSNNLDTQLNSLCSTMDKLRLNVLQLEHRKQIIENSISKLSELIAKSENEIKESKESNPTSSQ